MSPLLPQVNTLTPQLARRQIVAASLFLMLGMSVPTASAEEHWPYPDPSGRGHFDLFQRTLTCHALLQHRHEDTVSGEQHGRIEKGINYTLNFAAFLLESGNVVDLDGTVLTTADLPAELAVGEAHWLEARSASGVTARRLADALSDCLGRFGHDWE